jgi:hypothetical protein
MLRRNAEAILCTLLTRKAENPEERRKIVYKQVLVNLIIIIKPKNVEPSTKIIPTAEKALSLSSHAVASKIV